MSRGPYRNRVAVLPGILAIVLASWAATAMGQSSAPLSDAAPVLEQLGRQAQDTSLPEAERLEVIRGLGQWGTAEVRAPLVALLTDVLPAIREGAARALGWEGNQEAVPALRERLEASGETPAVRAAVLESFGKIGGDGVRDAVLAAAADVDPRVRGAALIALTLGRLARSDDRIPLLRRLAADAALDPVARCEAIRQLASAHDTGASPLLLRLLESEPPLAIEVAPHTAPQGQIMAVRYQQARDVRAWAAAALGVLGAKEALPLLLKAAEDPGDFFLRLMSLRTLVAWNVPEASPVFLRRLNDLAPDNRVLAVAGLAKLGDRSGGDAVLARLSDPAPAVRVQAVAAVAILAPPQAARAALELLRTRELDATVQQAITAALARLAS